ncbi:MAG: hypothetical protein MUO42_00730 [Anaerolineaceae bacterium]|nr:hypothetical protein [Anaerolineaceae bacterium]
MSEINPLFIAHMPEVDIRPDIESVFIKARKAADDSREGEDGLYHRQVIIVTPGRLLISKMCPLPSELTTDELSRLSSLIPPHSLRNISVIANTYLEALKANILQAIPFFGYLLGFAALGHKVWVFEGHPSALKAGCRDADILLVDGEMLPFLDENTEWRATVLDGMRGKDIKIIAR